MNRIILSTCIALLLPQTVCGQLDSSLFRSWEASFAANEYNYDSGLGLELASPGLLNSPVCFRLKASKVWMNEYRAATGEWANYYLVELMAVYQFPTVDRARPYIELGLIEVFPSRKFSDVTSIAGVGVRAGIELFVFRNDRLQVAYYFGGGLNRVRAIAEKIDSAPQYAQGFVFTTGLRFYLPYSRTF